MTNEQDHLEPSPESLVEIPEVDFSRGIRPNRYANLHGKFEHAVFLDEELWRHFGSEERVIEALRLMVDVATRGTSQAA